MLYLVPQTDDPTDTAMSAMIVRLMASLPKPETFNIGGSTGISTTVAARHLADAIGQVCSALGDRVTLGSVIVQWDQALDAAARTLAAYSLFNLRGRNRQAGADEGIDIAAKDAQAYLARLRSPDREEQPLFVISPTGPAADVPLLSSAPTAQSWTRPKGHRFGPNGMFGGPC
jgi:hypothetical protein